MGLNVTANFFALNPPCSAGFGSGASSSGMLSCRLAAGWGFSVGFFGAGCSGSSSTRGAGSSLSFSATFLESSRSYFFEKSFL